MQADKSETLNRNEQRLADLRAKRKASPQADLLDVLESVDNTTAVLKTTKPPKPVKHAPRKPRAPNPKGMAPAVVPTQGMLNNIHDVSPKDAMMIMDVALYRLSKRETRPNDSIRYDFDEGYIEVRGGPEGMATVWDYDMVIMATSYFTEAMNKFRKGKGAAPPNLFRPNVNDIMKFCRRGKGGNQHDSLLNGLKRLADTTILISNMPVYENGEKKYLNKQTSLINTFSMLNNAKTGKVEHVEFELPTFMYDEITKSGTPSVLTVHPDYFLQDSGLARFSITWRARSQAKVAPPGRSTWCSSAAVAANAKS
jgi:hypothetical protein